MNVRCEADAKAIERPINDHQKLATCVIKQNDTYLIPSAYGTI